MTTSVSRRHFLLGASTLSVAGAAAPPARNALFISSDDLNHCLSAYGHKIVRTPNIDRIAKMGVRFDRSYCQFPLCSPSRTSLMTGRSPDATGVYNLQKHFRESVPDTVTLGQLFQKNGAVSARVGKIFHYGNPGQIGTNGLDDEPTWNTRINPIGIDKKEEPLLTNYTPTRGIGSALAFYASPGDDSQHTDGIVAEETIKLLEKHRKDRFFVACGFYKPHCPYIAPSKYFDQVPLDKIETIPFEEWEMNIAPKWAYFTTPPNWGLTKQQRKEAMRAYYATILFLDAQVGKVLDAAEKMKLFDNTVVTFWSDHGYGLGEHGQWMKQTLFEPSARAPMIIAGAGVKARGKACGRTVEFLDFYPTIADLCGLQGTPGYLHGKSLRPLLENPTARWDRPAITQTQRNRGQGAGLLMGYTLRTERYRYTMWDAGKEGEELYDYANDPAEMKNLAADAGSAGLKKSLRESLDRILQARKT